MKKMVALLAGLLTIAAASMVYAAPILSLSDGITTTVITDNGAGDVYSAPGVVTYVGNIGIWTLNVTTGQSDPLAGIYTTPRIDVATLNSSAGAGTLTVKFTDTGFKGSYPGFTMNLGGTQPTGSSVGFKAYYDTTNTAFGTQNLIGSLLLTDAAFSGSVSGTVPPDQDMFSLTEILTITHRGPGSTSFDAEVTVPEPGTFVLLGAGLLGLGIYGRRRAKK